MSHGRGRLTDVDHADDRRLDTVRALLAKAEATEFPSEAEAFFAKASELIARYAIDDALLWADGDSGDAPDELRLTVHAPYLAQKAVLVHAVAEAQGCRAVRLIASAGERREQIAVVGFASDLRWVETLVTSLLVQLTSAMLDQCPSGLTPSASAGWRRSFIVGFAEIVADRLETDRRDRVVAHDGSASVSSSTALVLVERGEEVTVEFRRRFPRIRSSWASSGSSRSGAAAGRRAGQEASFGSRSVAGRRSLGPG
jgi:hypothetical protein